ncbi:MAG TPA: MMPL family transporter, partial [Ktedonobacterales bacterium]|nr:MMPL family transporter [Ktedonobacterales bacterium]
PIVLVLLFIVFGSVVAGILPLIIGVVAILGSFAIVHVLTLYTDVSIFVLNIITGMGLGLAIDYGLFIVTRFREELGHNPADVRGAVQRTMATAGRTVLFSGLTVCTSMLSLLLFPEYFLRSMGMGAIAAVLVAMLAAITVLPAILALLGPRINALPLRRRRQLADVGEQHGAWYRLSQGVMRFPIPVALVVVAALILVGTPFLRASFAGFSITDLPTELSSRQVYDQLTQQFPHQSGAQVEIAVQTSGNALDAANLAALDGYVQQLQTISGVEQVQSLVTVDPRLTLAQYQQAYSHQGTIPALDATAARLASGDATRIDLTLSTRDNSSAAVNVVNEVRAMAPPSGFTTYVGGNTATQIDLFANLRSLIPIALAFIAIAIFVLLFLMTGSVVIPIKAIVLNTLSLTATFGALVFIFQEGHFANLLQLQFTGPLESTQPVLIFAIAFGLSMDYEVFLLSRIKERYDATGDNQLAVASGLQRTGGLITSAALLLAVVLGAFATSEIVFIKMLGVGLTIAILMDATLVRGLLVPATMRLLGRANWWTPAPLYWLWQRVGLSEQDRPSLTPTPSVTAE